MLKSKQKVTKKKPTKAAKKKPVKHTHLWSYGGGVCKCGCGKFLQPSGKVTSKP